jgi:signal transduction histidine kinase
LRAFLSRAASLPRLPDTPSIVRELERGAAASVGAPAANIGLWDANDQRLHFNPSSAAGPGSNPSSAAGPGSSASVQAGLSPTSSVVQREQSWEMDPARHPGAGRAFIEQRSTLVTDMARADPENATLYETYQARSALSAPISAGDKRLGVLVVYAPRAPVFANSDLELVQLLADQAAVVLESRALIDEAARVRAREEATRLKDDFLSSAAHDLKTPLTGLVTQAQLLQRRAERNPERPVDRQGLDRLLEQSLRLRDLVLELLDASRLEQGSLLGEREVAELGDLVRRAGRRQGASWQRLDLDTEAPVYANVDRLRMEQVVVNLVENGLKYSPPDGRVRVRVWQDGDEARLAVSDRGIGIPIEDQPLIFERFHRGRNVDDRRFAGMGLGLYIARGIVAEHGGRIWLESTPAVGSTFHVALPAAAPAGHASDTLSSSSAASG